MFEGFRNFVSDQPMVLPLDCFAFTFTSTLTLRFGPSALVVMAASI